MRRRQPRRRLAPWLALLGLLVAVALACDRDDAEAREATGGPAARGTEEGSGREATAEGGDVAQAGSETGSGGASTEGTGGQPVPGAPTPPPGFEAATLRQEELRGVALQALQSGDSDLAIAALISLIETPEASDLRASAALLLADLYHGVGESERAVGILQRLIAESPPVAEFEFVLGRTLGELERYDEAEAHLRRAIELGPDLLQSYLYLGSVLVAQGRQDDAADVYVGYERALQGMLQALTDPSTPTQHRLTIADGLSLANPDERITRALLTLLGEQNILSNAAAIQTLAAVGTAEAIEPLQAYAASTPHEELANAARQAAVMIAGRSRE